MRGYVARKGDRWYAVVYEGLDPVTGKEKRRWYPAGTSREEAELSHPGFSAHFVSCVTLSGRH